MLRFRTAASWLGNGKITKTFWRFSMNRLALLITIVFVFSFTSAFAEEDAILAKIAGTNTKITMSDLKRIISYYDADKQKMFEQNPQTKVNLVRRIIQAIVVAKIARDKDFDKRPEVKEQLGLLINDYLASDYLKEEVLDKIDVTEDDMKLYYKAHQEEFATPEMVKARHILIRVDKSASEEEKKKAREKAEDLLKKIKAGEDFVKLAGEFSEDPVTKARGGDVGFFPKGRMVPEFEKVVFSLKPDEVSEVFETSYGFHIAKVEEKKESAVAPFDKVKDKVKEKVLDEFKKTRISDFLEKALKDAGVEMNLDPLIDKK